jgi:hypothetical protein
MIVILSRSIKAGMALAILWFGEQPPRPQWAGSCS